MFSCLYSVCNIKISLENIVGLKVISLFSEITLKYGSLKDEPKTFDVLNFGIKKPDCLSTVGSG